MRNQLISIEHLQPLKPFVISRRPPIQYTTSMANCMRSTATSINYYEIEKPQ